MMGLPHTWKAYAFIRKNRFRKKLKINKMALDVMIDLTTAIYLLAIVGYMFAAIFIAGDFIQNYYDFFIMIEEQASQRFWFILTILPIRYINQSFSKPGVIFSTSEHHLAMLPFHRRDVWMLSVLGKWIKQIILYCIIGSLIVWITPISLSLIVTYMALLFVYDIIMTIPQWKLYQEKVIVKIGWLCAVLFASMIGFLLESPWVGIFVFLIILGMNAKLLSTLFDRINWGRVTEISDYHLWNMRLISKASDTPFKRHKKYSIFQNTKRRKRPFSYTQQAIHSRIWFLYLGKNITLLFQLIGALFVLLFVLFFISDAYFHVGIAIAIYVYTNMAATFFKDRFQADILHVLPWDLPGYKKTFLKWVIYGSLILLIPVAVYFFIHWTVWVPLKLLLYASVFLYAYHVKVGKAASVLAKRSISFEVEETLVILGLILVGMSSVYPAVSLSFIGFVWLLRNSIK